MNIITNVSRIIFVMFCTAVSVSWGDLPPEVKKCKSSNNAECIARTIEDILHRYPNGNPVFGMPNVSAFNITNLKVSRSNSDSPIQINFQFHKCTVYGLENLKILKSTGFNLELQNVETRVFAPRLRLQGDYEMMGKILLLPINGKGKGEVELIESDMAIRVKAQKQMRGNKTYVSVDKIKAIIEPKELAVNFENLFNGNDVLSKTLNDVINENWKDVWSELQDGINGAMEIIVTSLINSIFDTLPLEEAYDD